MKIFNTLRQWRMRRHAVRDERNKILMERLARLFNDSTTPHELSGPERDTPENYETAQTAKA